MNEKWRCSEVYLHACVVVVVVIIIIFTILVTIIITSIIKINIIIFDRDLTISATRLP
jgi:hypothetical protein